MFELQQRYPEQKYERTHVLAKQFHFIVERMYTEVEIASIEKALFLMFDLHVDQMRPDGEPYVFHTLSVAYEVLMHQKPTVNQLIAALLHDSLEDQKERLAEVSDLASDNVQEKAEFVLQEAFGVHVISYIKGLTNPDFDQALLASGLEKGTFDFQKRKNELYLKHFMEIAENPEIFAIKIMDFADNALKVKDLQDQKKKQKLLMKYTPVVVFLKEKLRKEKVYPNILERLETEFPT